LGGVFVFYFPSTELSFKLSGAVGATKPRLVFGRGPVRARSVPSTRGGRESRPVNLTGRIGHEMRFLHPAALWREPARCLSGVPGTQRLTIVYGLSTFVNRDGRRKDEAQHTLGFTVLSSSTCRSVSDHYSKGPEDPGAFALPTSDEIHFRSKSLRVWTKSAA
jgi:hypothetical protein